MYGKVRNTINYQGLSSISVQTGENSTVSTDLIANSNIKLVPTNTITPYIETDSENKTNTISFKLNNENYVDKDVLKDYVPLSEISVVREDNTSDIKNGYIKINNQDYQLVDKSEFDDYKEELNNKSIFLLSVKTTEEGKAEPFLYLNDDPDTTYCLITSAEKATFKPNDDNATLTERVKSLESLCNTLSQRLTNLEKNQT